MQKNNLELKHFCSKFERIREILEEIGAEKEGTKNQRDIFFCLPKVEDGIQRRLKLRVENRTKTLVYYKRPDFQEGKATGAEVLLYAVEDEELITFLSRALGELAVVEKEREVWRKDNTVFNLDTVKGVGGIFEIELQKEGEVVPEDEKTFHEYRKSFEAHLGEVVGGSNVDLVLEGKQ